MSVAWLRLIVGSLAGAATAVLALTAPTPPGSPDALAGYAALGAVVGGAVALVAPDDPRAWLAAIIGCSIGRALGALVTEPWVGGAGDTDVALPVDLMLALRSLMDAFNVATGAVLLDVVPLALASIPTWLVVRELRRRLRGRSAPIGQDR